MCEYCTAPVSSAHSLSADATSFFVPARPPAARRRAEREGRGVFEGVTRGASLSRGERARALRGSGGARARGALENPGARAARDECTDPTRARRP